MQASLNPVNAGKCSPFSLVGRRQEDAGAQQFEVKSRRRSAGHFGEGGIGDVGRTGQLAAAHLVRLGAHAVQLVIGGAAEDRCGAVGDRVNDDEVTEPLQQVLDESAWVMTGLDHPVDGAEHRGGVTSREGVDDVVEQRGMRIAEERHGKFIVEAAGTGAGHQLIEH